MSILKTAYAQFILGIMLVSAVVSSTMVVMAVGEQQPVTSIYLQADGYANVVEYLNVSSFTPVNVTLLGFPQGLTITYPNGGPVLYNLSADTVQILPSANSTVEINYFTISIILKNDVSWTANFTSANPVILYLPQGATLLYVNRQPTNISNENGLLTLALPAGGWTVGYMLAVGKASSPGYQIAEWVYGLIIVAAVAVIALLVIFVRRRHKAARGGIGLNVADSQVLDYLKKRGGSALESEIRRDLIIPKTSEWRTIKRLERNGLVRVEKTNKENKVTVI